MEDATARTLGSGSFQVERTNWIVVTYALLNLAARATGFGFPWSELGGLG